MDVDHLDRAFAAIGARVKVREAPRPRYSWERPRPLAIDVGNDRRGEFFEIRKGPNVDPDILAMSVQPEDRHLLLMVKGVPDADDSSKPGSAQKFLCGHDERSWFVAAVGSTPSNVREAKEVLKPLVVVASQNAMKVKTKHRNKRKNAGFIRQGEWFFVPRPGFVPEDDAILEKEPLIRGRGKPHVAQFVYRRGGTTVYVARGYPQGLTQAEYEKLIRSNPDAAKLNWQTRVRNPQVLAKGKVKHPDHRTIVLPCWHRAVPNTESRAPGMSHLAFLD